MDKHVEERFERIERTLDETRVILKEHAQINKDTALLARENQKRLDLLLAKMDEFLEEQRKPERTNLMR